MHLLITGLSAGLGHGFAALALEAGHSVWGCSRRRPDDLLARYPDRLHFATIDLADSERGPDRVRAWVEGAASFDRVILNAGVLPPMADLRETPLARLRSTMEVNLWANQWILQTLLDGPASLREVIAISSGAAVSGHRGWNGYALSKAALNMLMQLYAAECPGVRFIAFAPGLIDTEMQADLARVEDPDGRFGVLKRLRAARGTSEMPDPATAARRCWEAFAQLDDYPNGSFVDVRKMSAADREKDAGD